MDGSKAELLERIERLENETRQLADRQAIIDCITAFCRGVNRLDRDLILSVFHPDAVDDHGFFVGDREAFLKWIEEGVYNKLSFAQHYVGNYTVELNGDEAHSESYFFVVNKEPGSAEVLLRGGRYIDRFERRDGEWAIAARVCLLEWNSAAKDHSYPEDIQNMLDQAGIPAKDRSDPSYQRPLRIFRKAQAVEPR